MFLQRLRYPRLALNFHVAKYNFELLIFCLYFPSVGIMGMHHHAPSVWCWGFTRASQVQLGYILRPGILKYFLKFENFNFVYHDQIDRFMLVFFFQFFFLFCPCQDCCVQKWWQSSVMRTKPFSVLPLVKMFAGLTDIFLKHNKQTYLFLVL